MCGFLPGEASGPVGTVRPGRAVIEGVVAREGELVPGAYVRLLDSGGEFTAEVQTDWAGRFRFFAAAGQWTLRTLAPGVETTDTSVSVESGKVLAVEVMLD